MGRGETSGARMLTAMKTQASDRVIALAGNPNVGKSTVFNALTGLNQHTGNWPGKTVASAQGTHRSGDKNYVLVDLPGTYSIMAHSSEEEIARDFILFGGAQAVIVVCDATCMERNLNLVMQIMEITPKVIVCVNLLDEAKKKKIPVDLEGLEQELGVPVVGTSARSGKGLARLIERTEALCSGEITTTPRRVRYNTQVAYAAAPLTEVLERRLDSALDAGWLALRLLEQDETLLNGIRGHLGFDPLEDPQVSSAVFLAGHSLEKAGITREALKDIVVSSIIFSAEEVALRVAPVCAGCDGCGSWGGGGPSVGVDAGDRDRKLDRILTSKRTGIPIMLGLLCGVFWLTIIGANYPSELLSDFLLGGQNRLSGLFRQLGAPLWLHDILVLGVYRVLAWVVSVMLPPMAIFFPLFTLLEDFGYLPRVAFNLDHSFKKAKACGKQALTMWMGNLCCEEKRPQRKIPMRRGVPPRLIGVLCCLRL